MSKTESIRLTPRLQAIADQVRKGARLADIGTDHAHLPIWLIEQGRIRQAVASDIREGPLARARENSARHGCQTQITLRLGAGLERIAPEECDTIVIAGMGGETIAGILHDAPWTAQGGHTLLLQPMTMAAELRQALYREGFSIERETLCREEHRRYVVLTVRGGAASREVPLGACCLSPALLLAEGAKDYLTHLLTRETRALEGLQRARQADMSRLHTQELTVQTLKQGLEELL